MKENQTVADLNKGLLFPLLVYDLDKLPAETHIPNSMIFDVDENAFDMLEDIINKEYEQYLPSQRFARFIIDLQLDS